MMKINAAEYWSMMMYTGALNMTERSYRKFLADCGTGWLMLWMAVQMCSGSDNLTMWWPGALSWSFSQL